MEQSVEFRIRRVTRYKYDLVLLRDGEIVIGHDLAQYEVMNLLRSHFLKMMDEISIGGSVNFQSTMKFM